MKIWLTIIVIGFSLLTLLTACIPPTPPVAPTPTPTTDIRINQPTDGAMVEQKEMVSGTSQLIPNGSVIWVVVFIPSVGNFYPQNNPADIQANGEWSSLICVGQVGESGLEADIIVVLADMNAQNAFNEYLVNARDKTDYPGLGQLPSGAIIYDRVSVVRK